MRHLHHLQHVLLLSEQFKPGIVKFKLFVRASRRLPCRLVHIHWCRLLDIKNGNTESPGELFKDTIKARFERQVGNF
ncbi:hypothetical protein LSAT2_028449 [Lamellibrachia satsuma]|nr:hypothetical protein LSAT2_028449 [Lamellibrachia satsuma]